MFQKSTKIMNLIVILFNKSLTHRLLPCTKSSNRCCYYYYSLLLTTTLVITFLLLFFNNPDSNNTSIDIQLITITNNPIIATVPTPLLPSINLTNTFNPSTSSGYLTLHIENHNKYYFTAKWLGPVIVPISSFIDTETNQVEELQIPLFHQSPTSSTTTLKAFYHLPLPGNYYLSFTSLTINRTCILLLYSRMNPPNQYCPALFHEKQLISSEFIVQSSHIATTKKPTTTTITTAYWYTNNQPPYTNENICNYLKKSSLHYFFNFQQPNQQQQQQQQPIVNIKQWLSTSKYFTTTTTNNNSSMICFIGDSHIRFLYRDFIQAVMNYVPLFLWSSITDKIFYYPVHFVPQLKQILLSEEFNKKCGVGIISIGQWPLSNSACSSSSTADCISSIYDFTNDLIQVFQLFFDQQQSSSFIAIIPLIWLSINPCPVNYVENENPTRRDYRLRPYIKTWNVWVEKMLSENNLLGKNKITIIDSFHILDPIYMCTVDGCHYNGIVTFPVIELIIRELGG
jgi:hypothetical protein